MNSAQPLCDLLELWKGVLLTNSLSFTHAPQVTCDKLLLGPHACAPSALFYLGVYRFHMEWESGPLLVHQLFSLGMLILDHLHDD